MRFRVFPLFATSGYLGPTIRAGLLTTVLNMVHDEPHEEDVLRPLLADQPSPNTTKDQPTTVYWRPTILCILLFLVMGIGSFISAAPQLRLFESIICQQYYRDLDALPDGSGIPEQMCKAGPVQAALAELVGWQSFFDNIPGLLLALPYGILADRYGRRLVMTMSFVGQLGGFAWILMVCECCPDYPVG